MNEKEIERNMIKEERKAALALRIIEMLHNKAERFVDNKIGYMGFIERAVLESDKLELEVARQALIAQVAGALLGIMEDIHL